MKKFIKIAVLLLLLLPCTAFEIPQKVHWSVDAAAVGDDVYDITATGQIDGEDWHIYDLAEYVGGPNSTVFKVGGQGIEPIGEPRITSTVRRAYDDVFGMEVGTCPGPVVIVQRVRVTGNVDVDVHIEWQCCGQGNCLPPAEYDTRVNVSADSVAPSEPEAADGSLWALILEAILWGFAMLLTPCVFPMVPMTISFFMRGASSGAQGKFRALMYGLFIVLLYTVPISVIIVLTRIIGGDAVTADIFNYLATNWLPNIIFFLVFMVFAASFFGAFEITLPSGLVNSSDKKSGKAGMTGVFFMALTLVLVSFSCTGPIVGTVLIKSTRGEFWTPMVTMLAFSLAFAIPFTVLALFPGLLKNLPKSGGWLNSVKVVLGFVEIALGFKFLSVADQTYHWGILDREVYLAIWIVTFTLLGFYLLGKISFKYDDKVERIGVVRLALAIATFSFVVYMIPGMWGAPLKALSGYLPPITSQDFVLGSNDVPRTAAAPQDRRYSDFLELPYDIPAFFDYNEALEYASASGKPLFVAFTGHGCVNCREMETRVWSDPRVLAMLKDDYVVCALYADDKKVLDRSDWVVLENGKVLKTLGQVNSYFARTRFDVNAQPYYAIIDPNTGRQKVQPRGYDLDVDAYVDFLASGL